MANTPLVTCRAVLFETAYYHYYFFVSLLLFFFIFIILIFCQGCGRFRVVPGGFRVVPAGFRAVPAGSGWVPRFTYTPLLFRHGRPAEKLPLRRNSLRFGMDSMSLSNLRFLVSYTDRPKSDKNPKNLTKRYA